MTTFPTQMHVRGLEIPGPAVARMAMNFAIAKERARRLAVIAKPPSGPDEKAWRDKLIAHSPDAIFRSGRCLDC